MIRVSKARAGEGRGCLSTAWDIIHFLEPFRHLLPNKFPAIAGIQGLGHTLVFCSLPVGHDSFLRLRLFLH